MTVRRIAPLAILAAMFALLVLPVIILGFRSTAESYNQEMHHWLVIENFAEQWPRIDFSNYRSATSPGYHLLMAVPRKLGLESPSSIQLISSLFGLLVIAITYLVLLKWVPPWQAFVMTLPVAVAPYIISTSSWLATDMLSLVLILLILFLCSFSPVTAGRLVLLSILASLAVYTRQINLWLIGPILLAGLIASPLGFSLPDRLQSELDVVRRPRNFWFAVLACIPPLLVLAYLVDQWGGLTPPGYRELHNSGINFATPGFFLALSGFYGIFLLPLLASCRGYLVVPWSRVIVVCFIALAIVLLGGSSHDQEAGRWGGALWSLARIFPSIGNASVVLVPLAVLGALVLFSLWTIAMRTGSGRISTVLIISWFGSIAAQSFNSQCFQRYLGPLMIVLLTWLAVLAISGTRTRDRWWLAGFVLMALVQLAMALVIVHGPSLGSG